MDEDEEEKVFRIDATLHIIGGIEATSEEEAQQKFYDSLQWEGELQDITYK